jgi:DNA-directed RNA polymerase III subunit RPC2
MYFESRGYKEEQNPTMQAKFVENHHTHHDISEYTVAEYAHLFSIGIPQQVKLYGGITTVVGNLMHQLSFDKVCTKREGPLPSQCLEFALTYNGVIYGELTYIITNKLTGEVLMRRVEPNFLITPIPMPTSSEDFGHTNLFIIRGKIRIIPPTKTVGMNVPLLSQSDKSTKLQVRSQHYDKLYRSTSTLELLIDHQSRKVANANILQTRVPFLVKPIPISVIALCFGVSPDDFIDLVRSAASLNYDVNKYRPFEIAMRHCDVINQRDALMCLSLASGRKILSTGLNVAINEIFPHLNGCRTLSVTQAKVAMDVFPDGSNVCQCEHLTVLFREKVLFLAQCAAIVIGVRIGKIQSSSRDAYVNCEVISAADHLGSLFRSTFKNHVKSVNNVLRRTLLVEVRDIDLHKMFASCRLASRISSSIATGTWSLMRKGVSMGANVANCDAIVTQQRRLSSSITKTSGTHVDPREAQEDQYGFVCAAHSPDGDMIGLVHVLAIFATTVPPIPAADLATMDEYVHSQLVPFLTDRGTFAVIGILGGVVGRVNCTTDVVEHFRNLRRTLCITPYVSLHLLADQYTLRIFYRAGQLVRPLGTLRDTTPNPFDPNIDTSALISGSVEFITPQEQATCTRILPYHEARDDQKVATHIELSETSFGGYGFNSVIFPSSQQGPRASYYLLQCKQIVTGVPKNDLGATQMSTLVHTHRPLVQTAASQQMPMTVKDSPTGTPCVVAFMALPDNQEDAIIVCRSAVEFGMFDMNVDKRYTSTCTSSLTSNSVRGQATYGGNASANDGTQNRGVFLSEAFGKDLHSTGRQNKNYDNVGDCGLPLVGTMVNSNDVIISKTKTVRKIGANVQRVRNAISKHVDISTTCQGEGVVFDVRLAYKPTSAIAVVRIRSLLSLNVGDKLSTNFAQKGVVSAIWNREDMPYSMATGMQPDVIVSPLQIPSRMTIGTFVEALLGKQAALTGDIQIDDQRLHISNCERVKAIGAELAKRGFNRQGTELYVDGRTGKIIKNTHVFTGIIDIKRLHHLSQKKLYARSTGPRDTLTRQPKQGRSELGGLRNGEQETSAYACHGAAVTLQHRLRELSDIYKLFYCQLCSVAATGVESLDFYHCHICSSDEHIITLNVPFSLYLLSMELAATGVLMRLEAEDIEEA